MGRYTALHWGTFVQFTIDILGQASGYCGILFKER